MKNIPFDIAAFIGGIIFFAIRNIIGKWIVMAGWRLLKGVLIKSEKDMALFLHHRNKEARKRSRKSE